MAARPAAGRGRLVAGLAVLLFVWVWLFRFAPLGGAFGGFDNDHFLHFSYAKQVEAGAQPLRDFLDAGLQGARPSLTYEFSAAAQRALGDTLRSEALLTVTGVALASVATFLAAAKLAPWPWALGTALLAALASPKLYSYPKVLALSVIVLLIVTYARRPSRHVLVAMSIWTAVAFLFRHDYAVYCGIGTAAVIAATHWRASRTMTRRLAAFVLLAGLLLVPSLVWIQRYAGLVEYVRNGLEMSRSEDERTRRKEWPHPVLTSPVTAAALLDREENINAWLYYLFLALPVTAGAMALVLARAGEEPQRAVATLAVALVAVVVWRTFLRGNLGARFGEMAPLEAVLGAWLGGVATRGGGWTSPGRLASAALAAVVVVMTTACIWVQQSVASELRTGRLLSHPAALVERLGRVSAELKGLPAALRGTQGADMMAAAYLNQCTRPTDRIFFVTYAPEVLAFSERRFAGGRATVVPSFYKDPLYSRRTLAWLEAESVPVALVDKAERSGALLSVPILDEFLRQHYDEVGTFGPWRVLVRRDRAATGTWAGGLPCFG